jgi:hypothetical protein
MKQLVEEIAVFTKQCHVMFHRDCIGGVMVSVLVTSEEDLVLIGSNQRLENWYLLLLC